MLFYKAWLESRVRFVAGAAVLLAYCVSFVQGARINFPPALEPRLLYSVYIWRGVYDGLDTLVFILMAAMLGLGGIERERVSGASGFTLALPVTRLQLLLPRTVVALVEMAVLAAIPMLVVPWGSARIGHMYPAAQAGQFALLFATTGSLWVSAGIVCSVAFTGNHTSTMASVLVPAICAAVFGGPVLRAHPALNPLNIMNGRHLHFLDSSTDFIVRPLPSTALVGCLLISAGLLMFAAMVASRRDY
jgi:hypothetical protein